jgi:hypothetical protein
VLGRKIVEGQQLLLVAGDLGDGFGVFGLVSSGEVRDGLLGVLAVPAGEGDQLLLPAGALSFTRGAITSTAPATVVTSRGRACPLRTTSRWPFSSRSPACAAT